MKALFTLLLSGLALGQTTTSPTTPPAYMHEAVLHGDIQAFPLTLVNAFPFITAEVNGQKGKFMFDTGTDEALFLNSHRLALKPGQQLGAGKMGSGQAFTRTVQDTVAEVKFANGLTYRNLLGIRSANLDFLENHITPDCIGQIGFKFFTGYLFKLDYTRNQLTFYRDTPQRRASQDFLKGEKVVAVLHFETRALARFPILKVKAGQQELVAHFDTGQYGMLLLSGAARQALQRKGLAQLGIDGRQDTVCSLKHVRFAEGLQVDLPALTVFQKAQTTFLSEKLGITELNAIGLGYRFLAQYTTVWDYPGKRIYVLEK